MALLRGLHPGDTAGPGLNPLLREFENHDPGQLAAINFFLPRTSPAGILTAVPCHSKRLALTELEAFARALLAVLLALFDARITSEQTFCLQCLAQLWVELDEGARHAHLHCVGL
jgi:hypothetical protein